MSTPKKPTFKETFIAVGQDEIDKNKEQRQIIKSVGGIVTGLMVIAAIAYTWFPIVSVIALVIAIIAMAGRQLLIKQAKQDFADLEQAAQALAKGIQPEECREFIRLRTAQMLADNKMLTDAAKARLRELAALG